MMDLMDYYPIISFPKVQVDGKTVYKIPQLFKNRYGYENLFKSIDRSWEQRL
jgi:hypothetical protein